MRLILLSSDDSRTNRRIDEFVKDYVGRGDTVTYIPSCSFGCEPYLKSFERYFRRFGVRKFVLLPPDRLVSQGLLTEAFSSDAVFLSGGNTFAFLQSLRRHGLMARLRDFAKRDGLMIGASAGSIMMTPAIHTASIPSFAADENSVGLRRLAALNLVQFEFSPHALSTDRYRKEMERYSKRTEFPLYSCADGGGVIVDGASLTLVGPIDVFAAGKLAQRVR